MEQVTECQVCTHYISLTHCKTTQDSSDLVNISGPTITNHPNSSNLVMIGYNKCVKGKCLQDKIKKKRHQNQTLRKKENNSKQKPQKEMGQQKANT